MVYIYFFSVSLIILLGIEIYKKFIKKGGIFFLYFSLSAAIWYMLYIISFDNSLGEKMIYVYKTQYFLSITGFYSFTIFIFFHLFQFSQKILRILYYIFGLLFFISFQGIIISPYIISGIQYSTELGSYAEIYGPVYFMLPFLYFMIFPIILSSFILSFRRLKYYERIRIFYVIFGFLSYLLLSLIFTVYIPYIVSDSTALFFEKYLIMYISPLFISLVYVGHKYDFSNVKVEIFKVFIFIFSIIFSVVCLLFGHIFFGEIFSKIFEYWGENSTNISSIIFGILIFHSTNNFLLSYLSALKIDFIHLKKDIQDILFPNQILKKIENEFYRTFQVKKIFYIPYSENIVSPILLDFFKKNNAYFINDAFYLEEKYGISYKEVVSELKRFVSPEDISMIFPIYFLNKKIRAFFIVGHKKLYQIFSKNEIEAIQDFLSFLELHFEYIDTYQKLQDITLNLDKRVDEKTIEFNTLIGKQKEFIRYLGHEIKNPLTNVIFLGDELRQNIKALPNQEILKEDISLLYDELIRISELVKQVFTAEQFDLEKIKFYKTKTNLTKFLGDIVKSFISSHPHIYFLTEIEGNLGDYEIDEIQFRQMIENLLQNAVKFANLEKPKIQICAKKNLDETLFISVSDNGKGFKNDANHDMFEKYTTGEGDGTGLGLGLYLCKRISEMHGGNIISRNSEKLGGAEFVITLF